MVSIRVEIRGGVLVPLDDISALVPGTKAEIEVVQTSNDVPPELAALIGTRQVPSISPEERAAIQAKLAQSAGAIRDDPMTIEEINAFQDDLRRTQAEFEQQRWIDASSSPTATS